MTNLERQCESCASSRIKLHKLRTELAYWICESCGHCLIQSQLSNDENFGKAQEMYFGQDSILIQLKPTSLDDEILTERQRVTSDYVQPGGAVLEVGPGAGFFSQWLLERGNQPHLVEHSPVLADLLRDRLKVQVTSGEFETTDLPPASFQAFCSFHVIEHVVDPLRHLQVGLAMVRSGGYGFIATPNARSWQQRWFSLLSPNFDAAHLRVFSPASLRKFCEQAGWEIVRFETPEFTTGWLRVASKLLRRLRNEDETLTAGKYAGIPSSRSQWIYRLLTTLTSPLRQIQKHAGAGNEVFFVIRKPKLDPSQ